MEKGTVAALPPPDPRQGLVTGKLVDGDGAPIAGMAVALVAKQIRTETPLGATTTSNTGEYTIAYARKSAFNLIARASDAAGKVIAASATIFAAPAQVAIDLTTARDGIVRAPSRFTLLQAAVSTALQGTPLEEFRENKDTHDLSFLASSIGAPLAQVAELFIAHVLSVKYQLREQTLFGLFVSGMPPNLKAALSELPDAGINDAFTSQVLSGILAQGRAVLDRALSAAVTSNTLPVSYTDAQQAELSRLDAIRVASVGSTPYIRGKTPLNELLAAGAVVPAVQTAFVHAYAANGRRLGPTWKVLRADKSLAKADLAKLNTVLSAGESLTGNLPLVKDTLQRLSQKTLASLRDLALLDQREWEARIRQVDPNATTIPQVLPGDTAADRIARFARSLADRFAGRYPTVAFIGGLSRAKTSSFKARDELIDVLTANPKWNIRRTNIDQFVATNKLTVSPAALAELKTAQRLHRVSPHYASVEALNAAGFKSAQSIYFKGRAPFLAQMTNPLGSAALARTAYARAQMTYATALMAIGRYNLAFRGATPASISTAAPDPGTIANLPDLQALFGSLDSFQCEDCQSAYSPAAYLVDLLEYLSGFSATPLPGSAPPISTIATARDAFLLRRPEIQFVALSCNNTNVTIPYIDLVNEILEAAIAPSGIARPTVIDTEGSSAERRALPQSIQPQVAAAAYAAAAEAVFPLSLPFDLSFAQTTASLAALGTSRVALLKLFPGAVGAPVIAGAALGINPALQAVINQANAIDPWTCWGLEQNPAQVIDPKTRLPYSPNPVDWVAALNKVPVLMNRAGLSLQQLYQLLEVTWVTQSAVTLQLGTTTVAGVSLLSSNTDDMIFSGLDSGVLDRANRFLRLWTATALQMWELDWALQQASDGALDDAFLIFLAGAIAVRTALNLPFQEVLTFWGSIETRDVTSHLGDEDVIVPSTFREIFANPTMRASWSTLFGNPATLSGAPIVYPASASPTAAELQPLNGIIAALGLNSGEISAILAASGAANTLSLPTLNALLRYARMASSLSLSVSDLILWIALTEGTPFGGTPVDTSEFLRRLAVMRGTKIAVHDLDYLLRGQSTSESALAFTAAQLTDVLQTVRDSVAKAVATSQLTLTSVSDSTPIAVGTAKPHGISTGARVWITGVRGVTAANGIFTVTVTGPASFTLSGSAGNGLWTGGGTVTTDLDATIQTIVIVALATATTAPANVVTPVLAKIGVLPLDAVTVESLLAEGTVDPTQFPSLSAAFIRVAKACALFNALKPNALAFRFVVQNAATFRWLDPGALPLEPVEASPYGAFETMLQALKLEQRQTARTPKLFDVLGRWLVPGALPGDVATAIGGPTLLVAAASNQSPIAITTTTPHGLASGARVSISLVQGNTAANGTFTITVTGVSSFTLDGTAGNGIWIAGGLVTSPDALSLAPALNAGIADISRIAAALGVAAPSLDPNLQARTLTDIATLTAIASALDVVARHGISGATLMLLAAAAPGQDSADAAMGALQAQYPQSAWFAAVQPVQDKLRQARRDALVAYLLGPGPVASPGARFLTTNDVFDYYLIDPEMSPCSSTTRLLQPSLAIQQFVQQCLLSLSIGATVDTADTRWSEWSWRRQYRLWQANREVFLYPENYLLPELRKSASPFFADLETDLRQSTCNADAAEAAFENYLRKLVEVSRLGVAAHYNQTHPDGSQTLHVFAHTRGTPRQWFYRTRTSPTPGAGVWSAWAKLELDTASDHLLPVVWDQRLHLVWPVFKEKSEKPQGQPVPDQGGGTAPTAQKFWAVEFAMSELSASQWQPKQTIAEKMFFTKTMPLGGGVVDRPPQAFTFRAFQDSAFNLQIQVYYSLSALELTAAILGAAFGGTIPPLTGLTATATLLMPEAPLSVVQDPYLLPDAGLMDPASEPSYPLVTVASKSGALTAPASYGFSGQDLVYRFYFSPNPGSVPLGVLAQSTSSGPPINQVLLNTIVNPRLVIPHQEAVFDSLEPFFVADFTRIYLVQPHYYTVSSSPQEIDDLAYVKQWSTRYQFETFYHPYARTFLRELEIGGIPRLMSRNLQLNPQAVRGWPAIFSFQSSYNPQPAVATPYPGTPNAPDPGETALDFDPSSSGAYSLYNWEVFYHAPMFVAALLMQNQKYQDTMAWLKHIFNPTDNSGGAVPQRYWEMAPLNAMNAANWTSQEIQALLTTLTAHTQQGISDPATQNAILAWLADPFDPHLVASTRISAYARATVMKFLDNLIAWGDSLYAQYTAEMVSQAEQLYILADMILGPKPALLRQPAAQQGPAATYAALQGVDLFSNVLVNVENIIVAPEPPQSIIQGSAQAPSLPQFPGKGTALLFGIPPNNQLLAYWDKVAQRLYNIRHCLNLQGVAQPLPLYAPPINPLGLIAAQAAGANAATAASIAPIYRFATYLGHAVELTNDVRAYGALILSALEKQDAEALAVLRASQELDIQSRVLDVKSQQVNEAQDQLTALRNQQAVTQIRHDFYSTASFPNEWEATAMALQGAALIANGLALVLDMTAGTAHLVPSVTAGIAGFGGTPYATVSDGGANVGHASTAWSNVARDSAVILGESAGMAATMGGYQRRQDEWNLQAALASAELTQIASQIAAATDRLGIANSELAIQNAQIANATAVSDFLTRKYTNAQLYAYMVTQLTTVYAQAYQLAYNLAQQAQSAYQYELGRPTDQFIQFAYWDNQHKGLTAGENLLFDLRRMEAQYLANNLRELELTKHFSLALSQPLALVQLLQTGSCLIALDETLFDGDHPGHYFRRIRSVALTIPCVSGPYTSVSATLSLGAAVVRTTAPAASYQPWVWASAATNNDPGILTSPPVGATSIIATSSAHSDAGLFDVNLRDERWLPFEGQGAISTWNLRLDPRDNSFDLSTVTDVVLHIRYTSRLGGDAETVRTALKPSMARSVLVSVRSTFGDAYYRFFNPTDSTASQQTLTLPLTSAIFPFSNLGTPRITAVTVIVALKTPLNSAVANALGSGLEIDGSFGLTSSAPPAAVKLRSVAGAAANGTAIAALSSGHTALAAPTAPAVFTLTIPQTSLPPSLQTPANGPARLDPGLIDDIVLVIAYEIS